MALFLPGSSMFATKILHNGKLAVFLRRLYIGLLFLTAMMTKNPIVMTSAGVFILFLFARRQVAEIVITEFFIYAIGRRDLKQYYLDVSMYHQRRKGLTRYDDEIAVHEASAQLYFDKYQALKFSHRPGQNVQYVH